MQSYDLWSGVGRTVSTGAHPDPPRPATPALHPPWEQESSSEPSPQSSKKLQRRLALMHFLFSHRNSFLSWLQLLGLAVGDSAGARPAAVTLRVPPREPRGANGAGGGRAGTQGAYTHPPSFWEGADKANPSAWAKAGLC